MTPTEITPSERMELADLLIDRALISNNEAEQDVCRHIRAMLLDFNIPFSEVRATCIEKRTEHEHEAKARANRHASWEAVAAQLDRAHIYYFFILYIRRYTWYNEFLLKY